MSTDNKPAPQNTSPKGIDAPEGSTPAEAPGTHLETQSWPHGEIAGALDSGRLDVAIGYLPMLGDTLSLPLFKDRYVIVLRRDHPILWHWRRRQPGQEAELLSRLHYASVRSHADTSRILHLLGVERRVHLTAANFLSLPDTVKATDLAVLMPSQIATRFVALGEHALLEPELPLREFTVSLYWSRRFDHEPAQRWLRGRIEALFRAA